MNKKSLLSQTEQEEEINIKSWLDYEPGSPPPIPEKEEIPFNPSLRFQEEDYGRRMILIEKAILSKVKCIANRRKQKVNDCLRELVNQGLKQSLKDLES